LKDFVCRRRVLAGERLSFVPGWDCHGLPIELKVLQTLPSDEARNLTALDLRSKAGAFAKETVERQSSSFQRYGVWAEWEAPYLTLKKEYEAAQIRVFSSMVERGHVYRGKKPVHWSPSSRTALAEAELEYPDGHISPSVYVAMPVTTAPGGGQWVGHEGVSPDVAAALDGGDAAFAVWTTTPWTLPANLAVAINPRLTYSVCRVAGNGAEAGVRNGRVLIVGDALVEDVAKRLGEGVSLDVIGTVRGDALEGATYTHPCACAASRIAPIVAGGEYITLDSGTGLVHTAPGHGQEDYLTGLRCGLGLLSPVDEAGRFTDEAGPGLAGLVVTKEGNDAVVSQLRDASALLCKEDYEHKYPYDWRTKKPTIFRTTAQWFASVEGFRADALAAAASVRFVPSAGRARLEAMISGRGDWCISRQRRWGVPIPVFYDKETDEPLMDASTLAHVADIVAVHGTDAWWEMSIEDLLPGDRHHLAAKLRKGEDTMDVWFDSGTSWAGVLAERGLPVPADLYLEGSDQHRGWFQSSLLTGVASRGVAPFKTVLTHGFVLDEKGFKMSKSVGNVVDPLTVIDGGKNQKTEPPYGADVLRLWVASVDFTGDVSIGPGIVSQVADAYRKIRATVRFLLGCLGDFDPATNAVTLADLPALDRYILHRSEAYLEGSRAAFDDFAFFRLYQDAVRWCSTDLSTFYLDVCKDRLYLGPRDGPGRRAAQTALWHVARGLLASLAPITPHLAEDAFQACSALPGGGPGAAEAGRSVFDLGWPDTVEKDLCTADEVAAWDAVLTVRDVTNRALELARVAKVLGAPLEASASVWIENGSVLAPLKAELEADAGAPGDAASGAAGSLARLLIVSEARLVGSEADAREGYDHVETGMTEAGVKVVVGVRRARGSKCERCWVYSTRLGASEHPTLCPRCCEVVRTCGVDIASEMAA